MKGVMCPPKWDWGDDVPPQRGVGRRCVPQMGGVEEVCPPPKWDWGGDVPTQKVRQGGGVPPKWD